MKNLKMPAALLLLLALCFCVLGAKINANEKTKPVKVKASKTKTSKRQYQYWAVVTFGGNQYEFFCHGGGTSGTVADVYAACINGKAYANGTASGTFSISGGGMTLSNVYFTVPPFAQQGPLNGGASQWSNQHGITLSCGGGGPQ